MLTRAANTRVHPTDAGSQPVPPFPAAVPGPDAVAAGAPTLLGSGRQRKAAIAQPGARSELRERELRGRASALLLSMGPMSVATLRSSLQQVRDRARHPLLLHPLSPLKVAWDLLGALCVIYYSWMVPMMLAFDWYEPSWSTQRLMLVIDVLGMLDIALRFRVGIIEDGVVVMRPQAIARDYLRSGWLPVDVLASAPFDLLLGASSATTSPKTLLVIKYFKLPRLLRIPRFVKQMRHLTKFSSPIIALHVVLFGAHVAACAWVALLRPCSGRSADAVAAAGSASAYCERGNGQVLRAYWIAFEHGVMSLLGVSDAHVERSDRFLQAGFGLAHPGEHSFVADTAYLWSTGVSVAGAVVSAGLVGTVISLSKSWSRAENAFRKKIDRVQHEMDALCLPKSLRRRISAYYDYLWLNNRAFSEELSLLQDQGMSLALREQIAIYLFKDYLLKIPFFQLASDSVLGMICMQLRQVIYMPGDFIIREGDIGKELFMIVKGVVRVMPPKDETAPHGSHIGSSGHANGTTTTTTTTTATRATNGHHHTDTSGDNNAAAEPKKILLGEGDFFGEIGVVMEVQRTRSVRAESIAELCILSRDGFHKIMVEFPVFATAMKRLIVKRVGEMWTQGDDKEQVDKMTALTDLKMKKAAQTYRNMDKLRVKTRALQSIYPRFSLHGDELSLPTSEFELLEELELAADPAEGEQDASAEGLAALPSIAEAADDDSAHLAHSFEAKAYPTADWQPRESSRRERDEQYDDRTPLRTLARPPGGQDEGAAAALRPAGDEQQLQQLRQLVGRVDAWERRLHGRVGELEAAMDRLVAAVALLPRETM